MGADTRRGGERNAVAALVFGSLVAGLMQTIVLQIQGDLPGLLNAPREVTAWVVTSTILAACAFSPVSARLGDMFGRTRVAVALMVTLAVGSALSALAPSVGLVIAGRALQGLAIGVIPLGMSIMKHVVPAKRLGGSIAIASGTLGIGSAFGLPLGALISETLGWRMIFWTCCVLGAGGALWIWCAVPRRQERSVGSFDVIGAAGIAVGTSSLLVGLAQALSWGWTSVATIAAFSTGAVALLLTIWHLLRQAHPIIDVRASTTPRVLLTNLSAACLNFAMMGATVAFPQLLALPISSSPGLGLGHVISGLIMMASGLATAAATPVITALTARFGPKRMLLTGSAVIFLALAVAAAGLWSGGLLLAVNIVLGVGFGLAFAAMPQIIMESVPASNVAAATGLNAQIRFFGTASAAAIIASALAHWSVPTGGSGSPTVSGFQLSISLCAAAALLAIILSSRIPPLPAASTDRHAGLLPGHPTTQIP